MSMRIGDYAGISAGYQNNTGKAGKGDNLEDLMHQFTKKLSGSSSGFETGSFDVRA